MWDRTKAGQMPLKWFQSGGKCRLPDAGVRGAGMVVECREAGRGDEATLGKER